MKNRLILLAVALIAACAAPTREDIASADYGEPITLEQAVLITEDYLHNHLKDPATAKIEWGDFEKGYIKDPALYSLYGGGTHFGYKLKASINSKNSYGAYTGYRQYIFLLHDDAVVSAYAEQTQHGAYGSTTGMVKIK